ncbi:MAG: PSD1 and planctomycete cytochrome C domain-containing protein [Rhodothermales bacterium]
MLTGCSSEPKVLSVEEQLAALGEIDYNFHVKPILSQNCYLCHGPDASSREAELRLDLPEEAYAMRDSMPAITPGDKPGSLLFHRINASDPEERMPPPTAHKTLTPLQIAILEKWIEEGAVYKKHWSFIPPEKPAAPETSNAAWAKNDIDKFVLKRLDQEGLRPSKEANRRTLIRRLSFDLTGLPPTLEEVQTFVDDSSENAYENLVDRLLSSKHFGERMAVHWMDLARYADTNGYSIDGGRHMWLWRDWVINAFNENLPYDEFVVQQLAGDLLPDPTEAQLIATGFNRNHMNTHEGGTIAEENLTNYVVDRVKTTSEVFLGLTMACAQCHDHKFDPISQREYFQFFAYFNTLDDKGRDGDRGINSKPSIQTKTVLVDDQEIEQLKAALDRLSAIKDTEAAEQVAWEEGQRQHLQERGRNLAFTALDPIKITTPNRGNTGKVLEDGSLLIDEAGGLAAYNVSAHIKEANKPISGIRVVFYPHEVSKGYIGHSSREGMEGSIALTNITISKGTIPSDQVDMYNIVRYKQITASSSHPDYPTKDVFDERRINGWAPANDFLRTAQHLTVTFSEPITPKEASYMTVMLNFGQGNNLIPGNFKIYTMTGVDDDTNIPPDLQKSLLIAREDRSEEQSEAIKDYYYAYANETAPLRHNINNLQERLAVLTESHPTMVMNVAEDPRETFILNRGQYDQPLEKVTPETLDILPPLTADAESNRLGLAKWLTKPDHPLTSRVTVNRFWQMLFGKGIVETAADFGSQGGLPSHPELLDWLAVEFTDSDWDVKGLLKTMVMSATYRQNSAAEEDLLTQDPGNRLLARGPRFRLQAEFIRDAALKTSNLMVDRIGGPSVNPYQPAGLWKEVSHYGSTGATAQVFVQDHGEKLYRRSLYTYWKRTLPPPAMMTFDAPNREVCTITREVTNTPMQALVLLNDPQFVEASRHFAQRILHATLSDDEARLRMAFETILSRPPDRQELKILKGRLADERAYYKQSPESAVEYLHVGDSAPDPNLPVEEFAAWTTVASMIFNLSEAVTRS